MEKVKYKIHYHKRVLEKNIPDLPTRIRALVLKSIEERIAVDPISFGKPLWRSLRGYRRLRVSDYRIIYSVNVETKTVIITTIRHRSNVYK